MGYYDDEWGIARDDDPTELHRGPMDREEAERWVREWDELCSSTDAREEAPLYGDRGRGMFVVVSREVGPWGRVDG